MSALVVWVRMSVRFSLTPSLFQGMGSKGEIRIDQAKRGYDVTEDDQGQLVWYNPYVF